MTNPLPLLASSDLAPLRDALVVGGVAGAEVVGALPVEAHDVYTAIMAYVSLLILNELKKLNTKRPPKGGKEDP